MYHKTLERGVFNVKSKNLKLIVALCLIISMITLAACSGTSNSDASADQNDKPQPTQSGTEEDEESPDEGTYDPFGKYDPPIEVTALRIVDDTFKYNEGDSIDNNIWIKAYEEELGIKIKYNWVVSGGTQGEQKMNVSIASGDLADIIPVNASQLAQLVNADMVTDLTDIYEQYAAPYTKEVMHQEGDTAFDAATFQGKLMGIPITGSSMDSAALIWIRADWLKKLGLSDPKTMDDVLAISDAFTKNDPDGNGNDDTTGLALNKALYGGYASLDGFFNGYHAYPQIWVKDDSGNIVYGSVQPEMKAALQKLQELYEDGQIDREFGVKDEGKAAEYAASGRNGLNFGQMYNPLWPLQDSRTNDNSADWRAYPLVSIDDKAAQPQVGNPFSGFFAINKDAKNPEAAIKLVNLFIEKGWGATADPEHYFNDNGVEKHKYAVIAAWSADKNLVAHLNIKEATSTGDFSILNPEEVGYNEQIKKFLAGDNSQWGVDAVFGETGSFMTIDKYVNDDIFVRNEFFGAPTSTMVEKTSTLSKMEVEVFTKIIMGDSIDLFDKFVEDWKNLGGDDITKEVSDWNAAR